MVLSSARTGFMSDRSVFLAAWNVDGVRAGVWHSIDSMSGLAFPCIHSADEIGLVTGKSVAVVENITDAE